MGRRGGGGGRNVPSDVKTNWDVMRDDPRISEQHIRDLKQQEKALAHDTMRRGNRGGGGGRQTTPSADHITDRPSRYRNMQSVQDSPSGFTPDIKGINTPKTNQYIDPKENWSYLRKKRYESMRKGRKRKVMGDLPFEV